MKKPTIAQLEGQNLELVGRVAELEKDARNRNDAASSMIIERDRRIRDLEQQLRDRDQEIQFLKDELHRLTIENAGLEGYRQRVREFDPVSEQQAYRDQAALDRPAPWAGGIAIGGEHAAMRGQGQPVPWYRRRA